MITDSFLVEALEEDFNMRTTTIGKSLYKNRSVINIAISKDEIDAIVYDKKKYTVQFKRTEDKKYVYFDGTCRCNEEACEHQAAALYAAIAHVKENKITTKRARPKKILTKKTPVKLEGKHAGEYRLIPMDFGLNKALGMYRTKDHLVRGGDLGWHETWQGTFLSPSEIVFENVSKNNYDYINRRLKIQLKVEEDEIYVKCLCCKNKEPLFCTHQTILLNAISQNSSSFNFINPTKRYEKILNSAAKEMKLKRDIVEKHFKVIIGPTGHSLITKQSNFVTKEWIEFTQLFIKEDKELQQRLNKEETERLEEGRDKRHGFLWHLHSDDEGNNRYLGIHFGTGSSYKTKDGIKDFTQNLDEHPFGLPKGIQSIAQEIYFTTLDFEPEIQFNQIRKLISENIDLLNSIYHYTYTGNAYFDDPKVADLNLVKFDPDPIDCKISFELIDGLIHVSRHVTHKGKAFDFKEIVYSNPIFGATKKKAYLYPFFRFQEFMFFFPTDYDNVVFPNVSDKERTNLVNRFKKYFEVSIPNDFIMEEEILANPELQILLRETGNFVLFEPRIKYKEYSFNAFDEDIYFVEDKLYRVDQQDIDYLVNFVKNSHPEFDNAIQVQDYVYLDIKEMINNYWFIHFNEACETAGIAVLGHKDLSKFNFSKHRAKTYMHIKSGINWFDVEAGVSFGNEKIRTADWIKALRNKETFIQLKDGSLGMLPEAWLKQASKLLGVAEIEKDQMKISKYRFNIVEDLFEKIDDKKILKELEDKKARIKAINTNKKYKVPKNIKANLRDYQKHGYAWLKFLDESEFGGILADDMGLGKTLQVITLLADQIKKQTSLVIVPRSLLFNWAAELDKFCPDLKYIIHHGPIRTKEVDKINNYNIIITTYSTAANDIEFFKEYKFNYIILDESQAIKNPDSKRYKAIRLLESRNKLAMTGTPIENNTFDLFSQLNFTSPGLLGGRTSFKNNFSIPIDSNGDKEAAKFLRKLVHPFILRRTKDQVAKDLPEKTESIIYCEMGPNQRKLYDKLKAQIKKDIEEEVAEKGVNKSKFKMLDGLLRLRQMCNAPKLVNPSFSGANADAVKIEMLLEKLTEAIGQKHNALVFSQFVTLLSIVREELDKRGIRYAYLDGSTSKRQAEVDKFMNDDDIKVFLISIKAGNTGMNLTKADYVYILDPWWNPAVEAQAIDRTHRIGQTNQIFAYKLICKNSIEEKILKLQDKKKQLASDIIRTDENIMKSLKKEDLMALFD